MAKELPYFKFEPSEWQNGDIQMMPAETQLAFLNICCTYWQRKCVLPYAFALQKHCNGNTEVLDSLIDCNIITINEDETISISFLNQQFYEVKNKSKTAAKSAKARWDKEKDANAMQTHSESNAIREDKIRQEKRKEDNKNNIEERKLKFAETLKPFIETYGKDMVKDFYLYWTEPNKSNTKFRQELERTWSPERRLISWNKNNFGNKNKGGNDQQQTRPSVPIG